MCGNDPPILDDAAFVPPGIICTMLILASCHESVVALRVALVVVAQLAMYMEILLGIFPTTSSRVAYLDSQIAELSLAVMTMDSDHIGGTSVVMMGMKQQLQQHDKNMSVSFLP